ncbi:hypothetical protein GGX14DRAFT_603949 [Mycena pura]|uniref:Uncharacterized protein n=1 Tax=Mycena pura TaxID=153505 RepID=A0AAD6UMT6_9AGAR|nr:hypothetical protein GGX14DRAFT_603949 [Mycena pura]
MPAGHTPLHAPPARAAGRRSPPAREVQDPLLAVRHARIVLPTTGACHLPERFPPSLSRLPLSATTRASAKSLMPAPALEPTHAHPRCARPAAHARSPRPLSRVRLPPHTLSLTLQFPPSPFPCSLGRNCPCGSTPMSLPCLNAANICRLFLPADPPRDAQWQPTIARISEAERSPGLPSAAFTPPSLSGFALRSPAVPPHARDSHNPASRAGSARAVVAAVRAVLSIVAAVPLPLAAGDMIQRRRLWRCLRADSVLCNDVLRLLCSSI